MTEPSYLNESTNNTTSQTDDEKIQLKIKDQNQSGPLKIKVYRTTSFSKVFKAYASHLGLSDVNSYKFNYDEGPINGHQTVEEVLGMDIKDPQLREEGFTIHAQANQMGGSYF